MKQDYYGYDIEVKKNKQEEERNSSRAAHKKQKA